MVRIKVMAWLMVGMVLGGLSGCATMAPSPEVDLNIPGKPGVLYLPGPRTGMTVESANAELSALLAANPLSRQVWLMRPHNDSVPSANDFTDFFIIFDGLLVHPDRIEFLKSRQVVFVLLYENLVDSEIFVKRETIHPYSEYTIAVSGLSVSFHGASLGAASRFADVVYFLQQKERLNSVERYGQTGEFEALAATYRAAAVKPAVTEEQRKFIVQANALGQQKDYAGAVERYGRVVGIDPAAYPEAWFNMALLSAQQGRYRSAVGFMKRYLLLAPDAKDARASQDKIYEWEVLMEKR